MINNRWTFRTHPLKIFISYRREDSVDSAGRLYSDLKAYFNRPFRTYLRRKVLVVRDFESMPSGINYRNVIEEEIRTSAAFIAIIGKEWLNFPDAKTGLRRLDDPHDTHRKEIATALLLAIPVFPVLVEGASMPGEEELPDSLKLLASQNAKSISDPQWDAKVKALINDLELVLTSRGPSLVKLSGITFLILLLAVLTVWGILKYVNCCDGNTNTVITNSNIVSPPVGNTSPTSVLAKDTLGSPPPTTSVTPVVTLTPGPSPATTVIAPNVVPAPSIAGSVWEFEKIGNSGKAFYGVVISFSSTGTYIFRCINKPSYPHKCAHEEWIDSKYQSFERKWELHGNTIKIYWNMGTKDEVMDVGEITADGTRMSGTGRATANEFGQYSWSASRTN